MKNLKLRLLAITVATTTIATIPSISASAAWIQNEGNWNYLSDSHQIIDLSSLFIEVQILYY